MDYGQIAARGKWETTLPLPIAHFVAHFIDPRARSALLRHSSSIFQLGGASYASPFDRCRRIWPLPYL